MNPEIQHFESKCIQSITTVVRHISRPEVLGRPVCVCVCVVPGVQRSGLGLFIFRRFFPWHVERHDPVTHQTNAPPRLRSACLEEGLNETGPPTPQNVLSLTDDNVVRGEFLLLLKERRTSYTRSTLRRKHSSTRGRSCLHSQASALVALSPCLSLGKVLKA